MPRLLPLLVVATAALSSCQYPQAGNQTRPFASGRNGQNLEKPPQRYGEDNRYVTPGADPNEGPISLGIDPRTAAEAAAAGIDPRTIPPSANTAPPSNVPASGATPPPSVDQGLSVAPPTTGMPPVTPGANPPAAPGEVPFARAVPGKPGYVYSPKDSRKVISVEGLRAGSKAKDPETGEIFRVPYQ
ncbi:MAG: hypothetical protein V4662_20325 [Verrucomicrobiota bacterium]